MAMTIAIANQKGGVAKTTTTFHLGHALVRRGLRVLLVDDDPQASLTVYAGHDPRTLEAKDLTLHALMFDRQDARSVIIPGEPALLPASIRLASAETELTAAWNGATILRDKLQTVLSMFDVVLIDCSPSLGLLTVNALAAANQVLVPVKTDYLSIMGVSLLFDTIDRIRTRLNPELGVLGLLPTIHDARNRHDKEALDELIAAMGRHHHVFAPVRRTTAFDRASVTSAVDEVRADVIRGIEEVADAIERQVR
ncbi:MAG TPA: AAA family ATPase [Geminicoccus sp.]|jgi:chromosome partitioning protein|uniref:ParA family protein n=1 Tax=Geminicoccus sp. TaxID=2024832 RepID=UPI002E33D5DB|nr:AAA family ATPase [Geminicoccus sp.]HEX2528832.1 AAA family ATPase [Geminicoccus sp.]